MKRPNDSLLGLGWQIAMTLLVFTLGGYGLDVWLDTKPWLMLSGAVLGMVSVGVQIWRIATDLNRRDQEREKQSGGSGIT